jgi:hypothetical protein
MASICADSLDEIGHGLAEVRGGLDITGARPHAA